MVVTSSENGDPSSRRAVNLEVDRYCRDCCLTVYQSCINQIKDIANKQMQKVNQVMNN